MLSALVDAGVEFLVVGGVAVSAHGWPRATKDLDVLIRANESNARVVWQALATFGAPLTALGITPGDFARVGQAIQLGVPPSRIDVLTSITGVSFDEASSDTIWFEVKGRRIPVIGLKALIQNKQASGRPEDLVDVRALTRIKRR